jgi:hypothetical protein
MNCGRAKKKFERPVISQTRGVEEAAIYVCAEEGQGGGGKPKLLQIMGTVQNGARLSFQCGAQP